MQDAVLIEGLKYQALVGVLPWEKQVRQPLIFDLKLYLPLREAAESEALELTINYAEVAQRIEALLQPHHDLIETVAEKVCADLLNHYPHLQAVELTLRKPAAVPAAQAVGVALKRVRE